MTTIVTILDMEVRGVEMHFLVLFSDNSVDYVHYTYLRHFYPGLYYSYFNIRITYKNHQFLY
jgi:hypothetical protein